MNGRRESGEEEEESEPEQGGTEEDDQLIDSQVSFQTNHENYSDEEWESDNKMIFGNYS